MFRKNCSALIFLLAISSTNVADSEELTTEDYKRMYEQLNKLYPDDDIQNTAAPRSLKNGFKAFCYDIKGFDYRIGEWDRDGYSGQVSEIVYPGGDKFLETDALFAYSVDYISDNAIAGTGSFKSFIYSMSINKNNKEMMMSRLGAGGIGSLFVGKCDFRFPQ